MTDLVIAPEAHRCRPPMVERWITPPPVRIDDPPGNPSRIEEVPPVGSVWRCPCGTCWMSKPRQNSAYLVSFGNRWVCVSPWRYRRQLKKLQKKVG